MKHLITSLLLCALLVACSRSNRGLSEKDNEQEAGTEAQMPVDSPDNSQYFPEDTIKTDTARTNMPVDSVPNGQ